MPSAGLEGSGVVPKNGAAKRLILSFAFACLIFGSNPKALRSVNVFHLPLI